MTNTIVAIDILAVAVASLANAKLAFNEALQMNNSEKSAVYNCLVSGGHLASATEDVDSVWRLVAELSAP